MENHKQASPLENALERVKLYKYAFQGKNMDLQYFASWKKKKKKKRKKKNLRNILCLKLVSCESFAFWYEFCFSAEF